MKILIDENIPKVTVVKLKKKYTDIMDIRGTSDEGMEDEKIWQIAQDEGRLLITTDKGFSRFRYQHNNGILIILLKQPTLMKIHKRIISTLEHYSEQEWENRLVIVRDTVISTWYRKNK